MFPRGFKTSWHPSEHFSCCSWLPPSFPHPFVDAQDSQTASAGEWVDLFDGKSLEGWTNPKGEKPGGGWVVEDGVLVRKDKGGDLDTAEEYGDFELEIEWKISPRGNSGIKYRVSDYGGRLLAPECQVLDDDRHPDSKKGRPGTRQAGVFYDVMAAIPGTKKLKPVGEWNKVRIVARGPGCEHWLNGVKILEYDSTSDASKEAVAGSKYKNTEGFGTSLKGRIYLQDHSDPVWYRNIRIRKLK